MSLGLELEHDPNVNLATWHNAVPVVKALRVRNAGDLAVDDVVLDLSTDPAVTAPLTLRIDRIEPGTTHVLERVDLRLDHAALAPLTESVRGMLRATATAAGSEPVTIEAPLRCLAWDEWPGTASLPELLASFVLPNHPRLPDLLRRAAALLQQATGSASLDGYQSRDPQRARAQVEALFAALQELGLTYVNPPASFEQDGQRVRLPEKILGQGLATCLDLSLLVAGCLEQIGLHPVIALVEGHAIPGAWLVDDTFSEAGIADPIRLRKRIDLGELVVFESTRVCASAQRAFADAAREARARLDDGDRFVAAVDVAAARRARILPLPVREADGTFVAGGADPAASPAAAPAVAPEPATPPPVAAEPEDRLTRWKRRLLDLSLRNRLLNYRVTRRSLPLLVHDVAALEDALASGSDWFELLPRPQPGPDADDGRARRLADDLGARRLRVDLAESELDGRALEVFRAWRSGLDESGSNLLHLAIGFLRWYESASSTTPRLAPILLLPLEIERRSARSGFRVRLADEEPRFNVSLLHKLRADFGVAAAGLDDLPGDAAGLDVAAILHGVREATRDLARFEVLEEAHVGLLSFTKHLMWLDLDARLDALRGNALLRRLLRLDDEPPPLPEPPLRRDLDAEVPPSSVLCPLDADSSQLQATLAAAEGHSFVLEGPPGTGKSQTISNLIAHCLAQGKRVLFVAEKRAALDVVYRRLERAGLGPFCLELHSDKARKRDVVQQLGRALQAAGGGGGGDAFARRAGELEAARARVNQTVAALHGERAQGLSARAMAARLTRLGPQPRVALDREPAGAAAIDAEAARVVAADLTAAAALVDPAAEHPWRAVGRTEWDAGFARALDGELGAARQLLTRLRTALTDADTFLALGTAHPSRTQLDLVLRLAQALRQAPPVPAALADDDGGQPAFLARRDAVARAVADGRERDRLRRELAPRWTPALLQLDLAPLRDRYRRNAHAFFLLRWLRLRGARRVLQACVRGRIGSASQVADDLDAAMRARELHDALLARGADLQRWLGPLWRDGEADWDAVEAALRFAEGLRDVARAFDPAAQDGGREHLRRWARLAAEGTFADTEAPAARALTALEQALVAFATARGELARTLELDVAVAFGGDPAPGHLDRVDGTLAAMQQAGSRLRDWCAYRRAAAALGAFGLGELGTRHARGELATAEIATCAERSLLDALLLELLADDDELRSFHGREHERRVDRFAELDRGLLQLAAREATSRLAARVPRDTDGAVDTSEVGILLRELRKQRRHLPPRQLLQRIPTLLPRLAPCMLMSPLSVAQYLDPELPPFDLVVFDEASQIPAWDAAGAIGRGSQTVVVGDSKQLPPTTFFQRLEGEDELADAADAEELESILDECVAVGMPQQRLLWHYRSRHESLIAFSNARYYDGSLHTFPSPDADRGHRGVRLHPVDGGVYDRGGTQTNRREAEALVADLVARLRAFGDLDQGGRERYRSIGVVTFSMAQQVLIEDLLERARRDEPLLDPYFAPGAVDEPVFVKNLENVQGDERDVILFSICYGPDVNGRVFMSFGPLNRQGGERRLNVAVTRAREELVVFSTLRGEHIDLSRTQATGARHLKAFLDYAAGDAAALAGGAPARESDDEPMLRAVVADALRDAGHRVDERVGESGFRIDLAVRHPDADRYALGVLCDGESYRTAACARDRERTRPSVLEHLGWRLHRIWALDWWQDPDGEVRRLLAAVESALAREVQPAAEPPPPEPARFASAPQAVAEATAPPLAVAPGPVVDYRAADTALLHDDPEVLFSDRHHGALIATLKHLIEVEAPITFDRCARRLAARFGHGRLGAKVRRRVEELIAASGAVADGDGVLWRDAGQAEGWELVRVPVDGDDDTRRDLDEIPAAELANAAAVVLRQQVALPEEDLCREAARLLGFARLGSALRQRLGDAVEQLCTDGRAQRSGDRVCAP